MFLFHLIKLMIAQLKAEKGIYNLERRLVNPQIARPFSVTKPERLSIGKNVTILRGCYFHCGGMPWSNGRGKITIGDNCIFGEGTILYGAGEVEIGDCVGTGPGTMIFSSRDDYSLEYAREPEVAHCFGKVKIESYAKIYSNVIIVPGVTIGEGAVIGAGSIVTRDVPPWTVVIGRPGRATMKRERDLALGLWKVGVWCTSELPSSEAGPAVRA